MAALAVALSLTASGAFAQTLAGALIAAYQNSPQLKSERAALRASDEAVASATAGLRPSVSLTAKSTGSSIFNSSTAVLNAQSFSNSLTLAAELMLWDGGRVEFAREVARMQVVMARHGLVLSEQQVLLDAATAFMDMHRDAEFLLLADNAQRVLTRQVEAMKDRFEVGDVRRTDVSLTEARLAGAISTYAQRQGALEITREFYHLATGTYPGKLSAPPALPDVPGSLEAAKSLAKSNHPSVKSAQAGVELARFNLLRAQAAMKPRVTVSASLGISSGNSVTSSSISSRSSGSVGLTGVVPIYQGGQLTSAERQARANLEKAQFDVQRAAQVIENNVTRAWMQMQIAAASIVARHKEVRASRVALRGMQEEAKLGARTMLDVQDAEQDLVQAEANLAASRRDQQVAVYSLLSAMGLLTVQHLKLGIATYDPTINYKKVKKAPAKTMREIQLEKIFKRAGR